MSKFSPSEIAWRLPPDAYGRMTEIRWKRTYDGKAGFELIVHAANQRDETQRIGLITPVQMAELAQIFASRKEWS